MVPKTYLFETYKNWFTSVDEDGWPVEYREPFGFTHIRIQCYRKALPNLNNPLIFSIVLRATNQRSGGFGSVQTNINNK